MDKLQPILKNHFWILLVPLLSMNLWGYFSANGALTAATKTRTEELDKVKSGIPAGTDNPNNDYTTELQKRNEVLEKYVNEELVDLWKRQQARMVWPPAVAADIPKKYKDAILNDKQNEKVRYTYQKGYPKFIRDLHASVEPFVAEKEKVRYEMTWTPKVDFPIHLIPQMRIGTLTITATEMWDAQEDIWVTQFILDAIRQMNKDADSETSAVVRRVLAYRLLGGDGVPVTAGGEMSSDSMMPAGYQGAPDMGAGGGQGGPAGRIASSVKFNPAEEFGAGGEPVVGGGNMMMSSSAPAGEGAASATEATGPLRYYKAVEENPFVERGFYLSVIINQNKLVDFLVALSNSEWPVRVVRFHFGKNPYAPDPFTAVRGGGASPTAAMGFGAGGLPSGGFGANPAGPGAESFQYQPTETDSSFSGPMSSGMGAGAGANTGYPVDALQHPDLVQLDLAGLITMYRQPPEEKAALEAAAAGTATPPEGASAEAPVDGAAAAPVDPAAPATGEPPAEAPAAEPGTPAAAPETPAPDATAPTAPVEGTPVPAEGTPAESPPAAPAGGTEPAAATPAPAAEAPTPAVEAPPAEAPANP